MGAFGARTQKPTWLIASGKWASGLARSVRGMEFEQSDTVHRSLDKDGKKRVQGSSTLKETQAYPEEYGREVYRVWQQHTNVQDALEITDCGSSSDESITGLEFKQLQLPHARLEQVAEWAGVSVDVLDF